MNANAVGPQGQQFPAPGAYENRQNVVRPPYGGYAVPNRYQPGAPNASLRPITCFNCGKRGFHYAQDCPEPPATESFRAQVRESVQERSRAYAARQGNVAPTPPAAQVTANVSAIPVTSGAVSPIVPLCTEANAALEETLNA